MKRTVLLLALLAVSALTLFAGRFSDARDAELVLYNGKIITVDEGFSIAQAIAIRGGRILAVGSNAEVQKWAGPGTKRIDLAGSTVTPGFIDGHPHLFGMEDVTLTDVKSVREILDIVRREAAQRKPGEWIILEQPGDPPYHFHMPGKLAEGRYPTRQELDAAAPNNPVYMKSSAFHDRPTTVFNTQALQQLGITRDSGPIEAVDIEREADGTPTGKVFGNLTYFSQSPLRNKLWALAPPRTLEEQVAELRRDMRRYNAGGVTAIYEGHGMPETTIAVYNEAWNRGQLTVRAYLVKTISQFAPTEQVIRQMDGYAAFRGPGFGDNMLRIGGVAAIFGDNVGFGAGFMRQPYVGYYGKEWQGLQLIEEEKLYQIAKAAAERNLRFNMQASGGKAIDITLGVFERVNREIPISDKRWVIEHCQFPSEQNMKDAVRLGVIPTTVTNFLWGQGNAYIKYYGRELADQAVPLRSWLDAGVPVALSTDYGPDDAMFTLWQTMARQNGWTGETFGPEQAITREEAIRIYTINVARVAHWEDDIGSLEKGKLADLVILDRDILTVPLNEIRETRVKATLVGGKVVYGSLDGLGRSQPAR